MQRKKTGFTIIEIVIAIALFTVLALGVIALVSFLLTTVRQQGGLLADSDTARKVAFQLVGELRNATTSSTGAYVLDTVGDQSLIFYSNIDGGTDVERIRYYIQNGALYKGVIKPTGSPLTYNAANETITKVQDNIANGGNRLFYYYTGSYNGVTDNYLSQPVNPANVRYIKIKMQVYNKAGVRNLSSYTINAGGTIRNIKDNLAN